MEVVAGDMFIATTLWSSKVLVTTKKHAVSCSYTLFKCLMVGPLKNAAMFLPITVSQKAFIKGTIPLKIELTGENIVNKKLCLTLFLSV